jgi:hypothetical protein
VAERPHAHQHDPVPPRPGRPGPRVLGGNYLRGGGLAVPDPAGRTGRPRRVPVHRDHDGGSRHPGEAGRAPAPRPPPPPETTEDLAALHRELAANVPLDVTAMAGVATDRNVELRVVPPFPLKRLPGA